MTTDDQMIQAAMQRAIDEDLAPSAAWLRKKFSVGYARAKRLRDEAVKLLDAGQVKKPLLDVEIDGDKATATVRSVGRIITPEQLIKLSELDLRIWKPTRPQIRKWDVVTKDADGNPQITEAFAVKVSFVERTNGRALANLFDDVLSEMRTHAPVYPKLSHNIPNGDYLYVVSIPDPHFGKLAWAAETGENYDVKIAQAAYDGALDKLAAMADGLQVARVLYVVGNDLLHTDREPSMTTAGTHQDMDGRWQKAYRAAFASVVRGVETLRSIAPVDVVVQPGNHDRERAWILGEGLGAWFRNADGVRVLNEPSPRRYYAMERVLLGLTHGDGERIKDLPGIMADETGAAWTRARRREWLIGHFHRRRHLDSMPLSDERGVLVRILPSLTGGDAWHVSKGYHGQRAAVGLAYALDGLSVIDYTVALADDDRRERGTFVISA